MIHFNTTCKTQGQIDLTRQVNVYPVENATQPNEHIRRNNVQKHYNKR